MNNISTIIFDLDGTLANTEPLWSSSTKSILAEYGILISDEEHECINRKIRGKSIFECMKAIKEMFNLNDNAEYLEQKMIKYFNSFRDNITPILNSEKFIQLAHKKFKIAIASNSNKYTMLKTIEKLSINEYFGDNVYSKDDVFGKPKPFPDIYLHAAKMLKSDTRNCIVIEDSETGILAAKNAGMYCIAVNTSGMKDKLINADLIVENFDELIEKFDNLFNYPS